MEPDSRAGDVYFVNMRSARARLRTSKPARGRKIFSWPYSLGRETPNVGRCVATPHLMQSRCGTVVTRRRYRLRIKRRGAQTRFAATIIRGDRTGREIL